MYVRAHLVGASGGIRLAQLLADDPWTDGAIDDLPGELAEEVDFAKRWAGSNSRLSQLWTYPLFGATALGGRALGLVRPLRGAVRRAIALEAMRSLVLAKKAMWELGLALHTDDGHIRRQIARFDEQADRQAAQLKSLHRISVREAFGTTTP